MIRSRGTRTARSYAPLEAIEPAVFNAISAEAAPQPVDRHLDVDLREAREELLAGLLIAAEDERRILLGEPPERGRDLLLVALRLRRDREAHHRLREAELRRLDLALGVEEQVARHRLLELGDRADVARPELLRLLVVLALELEQLADALLRVGPGVHERGVAVQRAAQDTEDVDPARERVGDRLEDERRRRGPVHADGGLLVGRRRDALREQVEERRRAEVLR